MVETINAMEDIQIYEEIKDRLKTSKDKYLDGEQVLKDLNISLDD